MEKKKTQAPRNVPVEYLNANGNILTHDGSPKRMVREIILMGRNSNIKTGWAFSVEGDRTERRIYRNSRAVAYGLAHQSGPGGRKTGRSETMRAWEEVYG